MLLWNKALWCDVPSHMTIPIQSNCIILALLHWSKNCLSLWVQECTFHVKGGLSQLNIWTSFAQNSLTYKKLYVDSNTSHISWKTGLLEAPCCLRGSTWSHSGPITATRMGVRILKSCVCGTVKNKNRYLEWTTKNHVSFLEQSQVTLFDCLK